MGVAYMISTELKEKHDLVNIMGGESEQSYRQTRLGKNEEGHRREYVYRTRGSVLQERNVDRSVNCTDPIIDGVHVVQKDSDCASVATVDGCMKNALAVLKKDTI